MNERTCHRQVLEQLKYFTWQDVLLSAIDIAIVAYLFYQVFVFIRGTRAVQLLKGIAILLVLVSLTQWLRLYTVNWILVQVRTMLIVALPIVFQQELRRALTQLGRGKLFSTNLFRSQSASITQVIDEVVEAAFNLSRTKTGALIIIEQETGLEEYMEDAVRLDALVSRELLENIFVPNTPLHDGAVVIREDRIVAAACFVPATEDPVTVELGARHRAAIGVSQVSDALAIVVSEETGTVSLASGGRLIRGLDSKTLRDKLLELMNPQSVMQIFRRGATK